MGGFGGAGGTRHDGEGALLAGLAHSDAKVRAACALLLDHVADNRCIGPLRHNPHEAVRRCAMHALVCDGCKECPLDTDVVGALIESARTDRSCAVRRRAQSALAGLAAGGGE